MQAIVSGFFNIRGSLKDFFTTWTSHFLKCNVKIWSEYVNARQISIISLTKTAVSTCICLRIQRSMVVSFKVPENLYALNRLEILYHFKLVIATLKESLQ